MKYQTDDAASRFTGILSAAGPRLLSLSLSRPRKNAPMSDSLPAGCLRIRVRPSPAGFFAELFTVTQAFHRTIPEAELPAFFTGVCLGCFGTATARRQDGAIIRVASLVSNKRGRLALLEYDEEPAAGQTEPARRIGLDTGVHGPLPFLVHLGIQSPQGKIIASKQGKFRQINRFLETLADVLPAVRPSAEGRPLRVLDFGCGKSYLTFSLYHFMVDQMHIPCEIIGIDSKAEVIDRCARLASTLGWTGLSFRSQTIEDFVTHDDGSPQDILVSLHACDTATDHALAYGIRRGVPVILAAPCCQHELNALLAANPPPDKFLAPILAHGLFRERFAALATDAIRARILEDAGYAVTVLEFVDMDDTPKNVLIRGIKGRGHTVAPGGAGSKPLFPGIELTLERLL